MRYLPFEHSENSIVVKSLCKPQKGVDMFSLIGQRTIPAFDSDKPAKVFYLFATFSLNKKKLNIINVEYNKFFV